MSIWNKRFYFPGDPENPKSPNFGRRTYRPPKLFYFLEKFLPTHTEVSLYILAASFVASWFLSVPFREDFWWLVESDDGDGSFLALLLILGIIYAIVAVFIPVKVKGYRSFFAPFLIFVSSFLLVFEYLELSGEQGGVFNVILAVYHFSWLFVLMLFFRAGQLSKKIIGGYHTPVFRVLYASALVVCVFWYFYTFVGSSVSWAIPVSTTLILWQLSEYIEQKVMGESVVLKD